VVIESPKHHVTPVEFQGHIVRSDVGTVPWLNGRLTQTGNHHHAPCRRVPLSEVSTGHQLLGPHVTIGAIPIFDGGLDDAVALCLARVRAGLTTRVATANLDFFYVSRRDAQLRSDLQSAHLVVADGMPVTWLAKLAGAVRTRRVAGVDFVMELCKIGGQAGGLRLAMYGSTEAIAHAAAAHIERMCPGVTITAVICPPFRKLDSAETAVVVSHLQKSDPEVVLVALGCPRQERFAAELAELVPGKTWLGVGGTFDFFAGRRTRAPRAAQRAGLEWLFRLAQEPRRLAGRYLLRDAPEFFRLLARVLIRRVLPHGKRPNGRVIVPIKSDPVD
jgi:N-acetylglucosaminyldiphosphoundecaprenol N-acetyl-beta-D-mannosaminyltransferase